MPVTCVRFMTATDGPAILKKNEVASGGDDVIRTIGTLRETSLHAALKTWYARPGDELEASVEGYQIDLRRGAQLIEIQTRNFAALKRQLTQVGAVSPVGVGPHRAAET